MSTCHIDVKSMFGLSMWIECWACWVNVRNLKSMLGLSMSESIPGPSSRCWACWVNVDVESISGLSSQWQPCLLQLWDKNMYIVCEASNTSSYFKNEKLRSICIKKEYTLHRFSYLPYLQILEAMNQCCFQCGALWFPWYSTPDASTVLLTIH